MLEKVLLETKAFYTRNTQIKESHGWKHVFNVFNHANKAIDCNLPKLSAIEALEVRTAALLHDVDDHKYFPSHQDYNNARNIMKTAKVPKPSISNILDMISVVSCSRNGNSVPDFVKRSNEYFRLIPRWADRLEASGSIGVLRCYQYNCEHGASLFSNTTPRPRTESEVWQFAPPQRFEEYQRSGGNSVDMMSHFYDKLLHVARPDPNIVRNSYLEEANRKSSQPLVHMCLYFGKHGDIDLNYIKNIEKEIFR